MNLFVYGTLLSAEVMAAVIGRVPGEPLPAALRGYVLQRNRHGDAAIYPGSHRDQVPGLVWCSITPAERLALDEYEAPADGTTAYVLTQVTVDTDRGPLLVWTYAGHPDALPPPAPAR